VAWQDAAPKDTLSDARPGLPLRVSGVRLVVVMVDGVWYGVEDRCSHAG
jgi:nitrite reductase/ring-hydroxylating ferredoxin subunit